MSSKLIRTLCIAALLASGSPLVAQEPLLLTEDSGGLLELEGERTLEILDIPGRISVRHGSEGEMRFAARKLGDREALRPVALWLDDTVLRLAPVGGEASEPLWVEIAVPPELGTRIETIDALIEVSGLRGGIRVRGRGLEFNARMLHGPVTVEAEDSDVQVVNVTDEIDVSGRGLAVRIENVDGLTLDVVDATVEISRVREQVDLQFENADVTAEGVEGAVQGDGETGTLGLTRCNGGGELRLTGAALQLIETKGTLRVETDADVLFQTHEGALKIRGRGSKVLGAQAKGGALEIETDDNEVKLEGIEGPTMLFGDRVVVEVKDAKGDVTISTTGSEVRVEKAAGKLTIDNEFGDVHVTEAAKLVHVVSRDGTVKLEQLKGPAQVEADGPEVEVHWAALQGTDTSTVENERGDVRASLPRNFRCTVDAQAPHGTVYSDFDEVRVTEDAHYGAGVLNGGQAPAPAVKKPTLRFKAGGDVHINGAGALDEAAGQGR